MTKGARKRTPLLFKTLFILNLIVGIGLVGAYLSTHFSPNTFPYIYYLGLGYPILLIITILYTVFWLFFKRRYVWFNVFIVILGWNHVRHFVSFNTTKYPTDQTAIKILSYNVRIFDLYNTGKRYESRDGIFSFLSKEKPEIACFQEFFHQEGGTDFVTRDTLIDILEAPYFQERYTHKMHDGKYFGLATFSQFPIIESGEIPFENDPNNFCIYATIVKGIDTIRVYNAHLGSIRLQDRDYAFFGDEETGKIYKRNPEEQMILKRLKTAYEKRAIQIEKVMESVKQSPYPVIFCGDLNDTPVSYCYRQLNNVLLDAFVVSGNGIGTTYIGKIPSNRIDYIFYSTEMTSDLFTTHDVIFSDHKPISARIIL
ncbi:MAG: endonuclease/exonuclease/phosphatase family protein [Putridiphycobacter sp.]|nr:endonuclease/exonuclease/phosphatase family protein [Putridiphycobacter sp.]